MGLIHWVCWREIHQHSAGTQRFHYSVSSGLPMKHSLLNGFVSSRFQCYISLSLSPSPSFRLYMNVPSYTPKAKMEPPTIVFPISSMVLQCLPTFTTRMAQMLAKQNSTTELLSKYGLYGFAQNWEKLPFWPSWQVMCLQTPSGFVHPQQASASQFRDAWTLQVHRKLG